MHTSTTPNSFNSTCTPAPHQTHLILHAHQYHNVGIFSSDIYIVVPSIGIVSEERLMVFSVFLAVAVTEVILYILLHADT